ncbi:hypothetical protein MGYG_08400 [Nannizzia gypsea CBS 118893]|uniref:Regulatory protein ral2 n=1 Tax=Arthroderma gypseum (strain ATCC MYA-4604 / CBS 118893) TaxID=535722 RepID=E4V5L4_ARTGP|nr:hypothetical protein MGYG_08400 [Nannizzia gypsea CBS 118893]EFR05389.1 hypothetical protein MGYG_08400 [Nannizzia gypsea CBS 118893]
MSLLNHGVRLDMFTDIMTGSEQHSSPLGFGSGSASESGSGAGPRLSLFNANTSTTPGAPASAPTNASPYSHSHSHSNSRSSRFASVKRYLRSGSDLVRSRSRSKSKSRNELGLFVDDTASPTAAPTTDGTVEFAGRTSREARVRSSTGPSSQSWFRADSSLEVVHPILLDPTHASPQPPTPPLPLPRPWGSSLSPQQKVPVSAPWSASTSASPSAASVLLPLSPPLSPTTEQPQPPTPVSPYGRSQERLLASPPPSAPPNLSYPSTSILSRLSERQSPDIPSMASIRRPSSSRGGDSGGNQNTITGSSLPIHSHSQSQSQSQSQPQQQSQNHSQTQNGTGATAGPTNLSGLVCNVHRTTGREPHALVGATTTILGDKLYVFGGRLLSRARPELTSDLYELDLIKRHWTKVHPTGDVPPPRYFHSMCPLGDTKLVCYGGMSPRAAVAGHPPTNISSSHSAGQEAQPEVVVMSDVHIYDVVTRTWTHINTANTPQGRYAHCATILPSSAPFVSANAPMTAIHNNPSTSNSNPHQGSIGVEIDGYGGAEMVVVGGQDSSNHYIEQISVFNLRSLKWTATSPLGRSCGAYRSVVVPLAGMSVNDLGAERADKDHANVNNSHDAVGTPGSAMLIYSNYNFLDVKLELQARLPDGKLVEKAMDTSVSPPGLRFPNGGVINGHFVVSGTYLTASKQEYALWALDLKTMTWGRIDAGGSIFSCGSWNRGIIWNRRSTFVILGHRKRNLVEDYNHRRINFSHICMVELEAFGLYENPRRAAPTSGYVSVSAPPLRSMLQPKFSVQCSGGRPYSAAAEKLGLMAQACTELADMDLLTIGGERIPVSSHILSRRWGPYFVQLLAKLPQWPGDSINDAATLRQPNAALNSRNSTITITPSLSTASQYSTATTLGQHYVNNSNNSSMNNASIIRTTVDGHRALPHPPLLACLVHLTLKFHLHTAFHQLSSAPFFNWLDPTRLTVFLEATVERLHQVLDGRNAAAVFNAAAMAAGVAAVPTSPSHSTEPWILSATHIPAHIATLTRALTTDGISSFSSSDAESIDRPNTASSTASASSGTAGRSTSSQRPANLRINTNFGNGRNRAESAENASIPNSASTNNSNGGLGYSDAELSQHASDQRGRVKGGRDVWTANISSVVGLQKRGLRGLMEGRRMRERGASSADTQDQNTGVIPVKMGLGIS